MSVFKSANLYYKEGASDKVYHATIEDLGGNYVVNFAYGRRGSALKTGSKTSSPTNLDEAKKIFESLVKEKTAKGYKYIDNNSKSDDSIPVVSDDLPETPSEIQCVLLNPIDEKEVDFYIQNNDWSAQEKLDGVRFMIQNYELSPRAINRKGKRVSIPTDIWNSVNKCKKQFFLDGELIGDKLYTFDILEYNGKCIRENKLEDRYEALKDVVKEINSENVILVSLHKSTKEKQKLYDSLFSENGEGIVFKKLDAKYYVGRPASGGSYVKHKFYSTCSCVVTAINKKRSAAIGLYKGKKLVKAGNVTISSNFEMPEAGDVVEVKYLYARKQSGALYQPIYLGKRTDISPNECVQSQLKFKKEDEI